MFSTSFESHLVAIDKIHVARFNVFVNKNCLLVAYQNFRLLVSVWTIFPTQISLEYILIIFLFRFPSHVLRCSCNNYFFVFVWCVLIFLMCFRQVSILGFLFLFFFLSNVDFIRVFIFYAVSFEFVSKLSIRSVFLILFVLGIKVIWKWNWWIRYL